MTRRGSSGGRARKWRNALAPGPLVGVDHREARRAEPGIHAEEVQHLAVGAADVAGEIVVQDDMHPVAADRGEVALELLGVARHLGIAQALGKVRVWRDAPPGASIRLRVEGGGEVADLLVAVVEMLGVERPDHLHRVAEHGDDLHPRREFGDLRRRALREEVPHVGRADALLRPGGREVRQVLLERQRRPVADVEVGAEEAHLLALGEEDLGMRAQVLVHRRRARLRRADDHEVRPP